jgi:thioredoxin-dependent peroxiredoxin
MKFFVALTLAFCFIGCQSDITLKEGEAAPAFALKSDDGKTITLAALKGKPVVLYFYPKDGTPGCTTEACNFRDNFSAFQTAGIEVLGISVDNESSHQKFKEEQKLNFTLLADSDKEVSKKYGVLGTMGWASRVTFLIDKEGKIKKIYREVNPEVHAAEVLALAKTL